MKRSTLVLLIIVVWTSSVHSQQYIDQYLTDSLTFTTIGTISNQLTSPTDLDFKPGTNELWVINRETESTGGSTVIFSNAGMSNQTYKRKQDGNAWHFMSLPSAIAFSDNGNFATSPDVLDANHGGGNYTGPTVWSGDPRIYANQPSGPAYNGSHLDMLHESPYSMGIASGGGNLFWVFDGYNGEIVSYEFSADHGPGFSDHSNGKIHRYTEVAVTRMTNMPSHMVVDKNTGWLYICEPAKGRVLRMNTNTGSKLQDLAQTTENLSEYWEMQGVTWEVYIDTGLVRPCGIDFADNRLLVSDNTNGDIVIYNTSGASAAEMGRIQTGQAGIMGIKIGTDGKIWYVNYTQKKLVRIDHSPVTTDATIQEITAPSVYAYVCNSAITPVVTLLNNGSDVLTSVTINYTVDNGSLNTFNWTGSLNPNATESVTLPAIAIAESKHRLSVYTSNPNGSSDLNAFNDDKIVDFASYTTVATLPFAEGFENFVFPPANWRYHNPPDWDITASVMPANRFSRKTGTGGFGNSTTCTKMDNYSGSDDITGQIDELLLPSLDFSNAVSPVTLSFNIAYAQYNTSSNDSLMVYVSTDCGNSWTRIYRDGGANLSTTSPQTTVFTPSVSQWKSIQLSLDSYMDQADVKIKFRSKSNYGNNLYLDDIKVEDNSTGISSLNTGVTPFSVYPNPTEGIVFIEMNGNQAMKEKTGIMVYDIMGKIILESNMGKKQNGLYALDLSAMENGVYFVHLKNPLQKSITKVVLSR